jgi:hypothetical protein
MRAHNLVLNTLKCVSPELNVNAIFSSARQQKATIHPLANRTAKAWIERASDVWSPVRSAASEQCWFGEIEGLFLFIWRFRKPDKKPLDSSEGGMESKFCPWSVMAILQ